MKRVLLLLAFVATLAAVPVATTLADNPFQSACDTAKQANNDPSHLPTVCNTTGADTITNSSGSDGVIVKVTHIIAYIAGIAAVIIVIVGGLQYITSDGDAQKAANGRRAITYALVGLVVIVLAQTIITYVAGKIT